MSAKYFLIIRNYVLSVSSQRKHHFYHQNTLLDAFRTNSRNIIGRSPSMVIPLLVNQYLTPMLHLTNFCYQRTVHGKHCGHLSCSMVDFLTNSLAISQILPHAPLKDTSLFSLLFQSTAQNVKFAEGKLIRNGHF